MRLNSTEKDLNKLTKRELEIIDHITKYVHPDIFFVSTVKYKTINIINIGDTDLSKDKFGTTKFNISKFFLEYDLENPIYFRTAITRNNDNTYKFKDRVIAIEVGDLEVQIRNPNLIDGLTHKISVELGIDVVTELQYRDPVVLSYNSTTQLTNYMKKVLIEKMRGYTFYITADSVRLMNKEFYRELPHGQYITLYFVGDKLQFIKPANTDNYVQLELQTNIDKSMKVYIKSEIGYFSLFTGNYRTISNTDEMYMLYAIINCEQLGLRKFLHYNDNMKLHLLKLIRGKMIELNNIEGYNKLIHLEITRFISRFRKDEFPNMYSILNISGTKCDNKDNTLFFTKDMELVDSCIEEIESFKVVTGI